MNVRRLGLLQWIGLGLGAAVWAVQHIVGFGITQAECGVGGTHRGTSTSLWEGVLMGVSVGLVLVAEAAAVAVFARTRGANFGDGPPGEGRFDGELPYTRLHFFATAAMVANLIFLMTILLDGSAAIVHGTCTQA